MSYKKWRNGEVNERLMESWGYKAPKSEVINENKEISHLCAMLVTEKSSGKVGHPINHTLLEDGTVTHYDVEFDDVIVEGMPVDSLSVEIQEMHHHSARREDKPHTEEKPRLSNEDHCGRREDDVMEEEELNEDVPEMSRAEAEKEFDEIIDDGPDDMSIGRKGDKTKMFRMTEDLIRKTIREAITNALKERNEG